MSHIKPLQSIWLKLPDGSRQAWRVEVRRGGLYQIIRDGETRQVTRDQIVRMGTHVRH